MQILDLFFFCDSCLLETNVKLFVFNHVTRAEVESSIAAPVKTSPKDKVKKTKIIVKS